MKAKTIKAVLRKKINEWIATIDDEEIRKMCRRDTIVTGGAIASMLLREKVNDYDVYFKTRATALAVTKYYVGKFPKKKKNGIEIPISIMEEEDRIKIVIKSAGVADENEGEEEYAYFEGDPTGERASEYLDEVIQDPGQIEDTYEQAQEAAQEIEDEDYRPVFLSTNAITLSGKIQIIIRFYGEPDEIHENYDFVHCTNYWTVDGHLELRPAALEALLTRELRYVGSKYPLCSLIRVRKFVARHWTINAGQILKMCMQVSALDLTDVKVLEDQLTGVDVAYFNQVIHLLEKKDPKHVDTTYLLEIINRMF